MPDKYSLAKCEHYGRQLAARLCQQRFEAEPAATLDGPALRQLTPLRQLNLLVLHQLLGRWQHEAEQLRSPYFDFEAAPVREALTQFMNMLSRHIQLGRAALEPLLAQAATDTLLLATDPAAAFERLLLPPSAATEAAVPLAYLQERLRYLDRSKPFIEAFLQSQSAPEIPLSRAAWREHFEQYLASHRAELPALPPLLAELNALLPLTEADLQEAPAAVEAAKPAVPTVSKPVPASEAPTASEIPVPEAPKPTPIAAPRPVATPAAPPELPAAAPAPKQPTPTAPAAPAAPEVPAAKPTVPSFVAAPAEAPLYAKLQATQPTAAPLAASLRAAAPGGTDTLAERGAPRVGSLREAISINQRYSFINELFGGENMDYHAAIAHLDELPSAEAAGAYVQELAARHDWSRKEEHVGRLLKLIERKFGPGA